MCVWRQLWLIIRKRLLWLEQQPCSLDRVLYHLYKEQTRMLQPRLRLFVVHYHQYKSLSVI